MVENGKLKGGTKHPRKNEVVWKDVTVCYVEVCGAYPGSGVGVFNLVSLVGGIDARIRYVIRRRRSDVQSRDMMDSSFAR